MLSKADEIKGVLRKLSDPKKAAFTPSFFKTAKGDYGEGDVFWGVSMPDQRALAKQYRSVELAELKPLLYSEVHEHRMTALLILTYQFEKADEKGRKAVYDFYFKHLAQVNNWDLVDSSAHKIMGEYLRDKDRSILRKLAKSKKLWEKRIAMIATSDYIRSGDFKDALVIAEILVHDEHDLIHKAVGWMLREIGKRNPEAEKKFLRKYHQTMPRTMWRYAVENGVKI